MSRAKLSVNINKYALLRNSRGHNAPNLLQSAATCILAGAHGITVHPRRDERHIKMDDVRRLAPWLKANFPPIELNVECENHPDLLDLCQEVSPDQVTLVPVTPGEITSDHGFDLPRQAAELRPAIDRLRQFNCRVSLFADPIPANMRAFADTGAHRVELYTGPFAWAYGTERQEAETSALFETAKAAVDCGLEVNAGHDLDRHNLLLMRGMPGLCEVSIGHAQICRALEVGTTASVQELLAALDWQM